MNKLKLKKEISFVLVVLFLVVLVSSLALAEKGRKVVRGDDKYKVNLKSGSNVKTWVNNLAVSDDKCKEIEVASSATNDVFVPFETQAEWETFLVAARAGQIPGLTLEDCDTWLVNNNHTDEQCTSSGGTVYNSGGNLFCRLSGSSCPSGWSQYNSWSTTTTSGHSHTWSNAERETWTVRSCGHHGDDCTSSKKYSEVSEVGCY